MRRAHASFILAVALATAGCKRSQEAPQAAPSASAAEAPAAGHQLRAPVAAGIPLDTKQIAAVVNPNNAPAASGNTGRVHGLVSATGDPPPKQALDDVPGDCERATEVYGTLFREGMLRSLADALVTVTGYDGYVPAKQDVVSVIGSGCAWDRRTLALTFGQRLEVVSKDRRSYMPKLVGTSTPGVLLAMPGGDAVKLYPTRPGRYLLVDAAQTFMKAEVFVLKYSTHAVTRLDGRYDISGIPPGEVTVTAFLPTTLQVVEKRVSIPPGGNVEVDFEVPYDRQTARPTDGGQAPTQGAGAKRASPPGKP